ncbi:MAG: SMC-Scp complex subunit ScpB [Pirellulaceae bacterium]
MSDRVSESSADTPAVADMASASAQAARAELEKLDPLRRVEAVLFLANEPLHSRKLAQLAGLADGTRANALIKQLNRGYDEQGRAFHVKQVAGGYQLRTRPMFSRWLSKIQNTPSAIRLTTPAMETLSVVAYRQPVLKAEIEAIRGVSCGELLRQLLDRGLVRIAGRSSELGNPFLYATTKRFLEVFGLPNIDALPRGKKLRGKGLPNWSTAQDTQTENPAKTGPNPLDEPDTNPQNHTLVDSADPAVSLPSQEPQPEEQ